METQRASAWCQVPASYTASFAKLPALVVELACENKGRKYLKRAIWGLNCSIQWPAVLHFITWFSAQMLLLVDMSLFCCLQSIQRSHFRSNESTLVQSISAIIVCASPNSPSQLPPFSVNPDFKPWRKLLKDEPQLPVYTRTACDGQTQEDFMNFVYIPRDADRKETHSVKDTFWTRCRIFCWRSQLLM